MAASHISPERSGRQAGASTNPGRARVGGAGAGEPAAVGRESGRGRSLRGKQLSNEPPTTEVGEGDYLSQNLNISMQSWANFICNLCVHLLNSREEPFILCLSRSSRDIAIGYSRHSCSRLASGDPHFLWPWRGSSVSRPLICPGLSVWGWARSREKRKLVS